MNVLQLCLTAALERCLVLDRDGVINKERDSMVLSPNDWQPIPGSLEAIARLHQGGWTIAVATNQSVVGRGRLTLAQLNDIHATMHRAVLDAGGKITAVYVCPHLPEAGCACRKPETGMLEAILRRFRLPKEHCLFAGDSRSDLDCVARLGGQPFLLRTGKGRQTEAEGGLPPRTRVFDDLLALAAYLLNRPVYGRQ